MWSLWNASTIPRGLVAAIPNQKPSIQYIPNLTSVRLHTLFRCEVSKAGTLWKPPFRNSPKLWVGQQLISKQPIWWSFDVWKSAQPRRGSYSLSSPWLHWSLWSLHCWDPRMSDVALPSATWTPSETSNESSWATLDLSSKIIRAASVSLLPLLLLLFVVLFLLRGWWPPHFIMLWSNHLLGLLVFLVLLLKSLRSPTSQGNSQNHSSACSHLKTTTKPGRSGLQHCNKCSRKECVQLAPCSSSPIASGEQLADVLCLGEKPRVFGDAFVWNASYTM